MAQKSLRLPKIKMDAKRDQHTTPQPATQMKKTIDVVTAPAHTEKSIDNPQPVTPNKEKSETSDDGSIASQERKNIAKKKKEKKAFKSNFVLDRKSYALQQYFNDISSERINK